MYLKRNLVICSLILILFSQFILAGVVTGRVTDTGSGDFLPGANVFLEGTNYGASSDRADRKSTRLNSSHALISYAVFCLKKKKNKKKKKQP